MTASGGAGSMASARSAVTVWNDGGAATRGKHISSWASNSPAEGFASIPTGPRSAPMGSPCPHRRLDGRLRAALRRAPVEADDAPGPAFPQFDLHGGTNLAPQRTRQQPVGARAGPSAMPLKTAGSFASPIGSSPSKARLLAARYTLVEDFWPSARFMGGIGVNSPVMGRRFLPMAQWAFMIRPFG